MRLQVLFLVSVSRKPAHRSYEFLKVLWEGIYDRSPESAEISFLCITMVMTRGQVIASLRERMEFAARNVLIANKTMSGTWTRAFL